MNTTTPCRIRAALAAATSLAVLMLATPTIASAQDLSYDTRTTAEGMMVRNGASGSQVFQAGHGQFSNGSVRIDYTESAIPSGFTATGHYMIMKKGSGTTVFVDPSKREYVEIDMADLAKAGVDAQKMVGGMVKTETSGITAKAENLGAGESIEGYTTVKYRMSYGYTTRMSVMGRTTETVMTSTSDIWVAPQLDGAMTPDSRTSASGSGSMADLTAELTKAWAQVPKGVILRSVTVTHSSTNGRARNLTRTTVVSNIKRGSINPSVFNIPAGYTKTDMLSAMSGQRPTR